MKYANQPTKTFKNILELLPLTFVQLFFIPRNFNATKVLQTYYLSNAEPIR